jgi:hypothetical protein
LGPAISLAPRFSEVEEDQIQKKGNHFNGFSKPLKRLNDHSFTQHTSLKRGANERLNRSKVDDPGRFLLNETFFLAALAAFFMF